MKKILKNKKIFAAFLVLGVLLIGGATTMALEVASSEKVKNTFSVADCDTKIVEHFGESALDKDIYVYNESETTAAYVRVRLTVSADAMGVNPVLDEKSKDSWIYGDDGFYYYLYPVQPKECTTKLLDAISLDENFDGTTFDVTAYEESCVATSGAKGKTSVKDIKAAFDKATKTNGGNN